MSRRGGPRALAVAVAATAIFVGGSSARAATFHCDRCALSIGGVDVVATGTLGTNPLSLDLRAYTPRWKLNGSELRDVVLTVRDAGERFRACVAGTFDRSRVLACTKLPRAMSSLQGARRIAVTWRVTGPKDSPRGHGTATIAWRGRRVPVERGEFALDLPVEIPGTDVSRITVAGNMAGTLAPLALNVTRTRLGGLGTAASIDPFEIRTDRAIATTLHLRGLELARVLDLVSHGKVAATGMIDADLAIRHDGSGFSIARGNVYARGRGRLRVRDLSWTREVIAAATRLDLQNRLATTLSDFAYDHLSMVLRPTTGCAPDATLAVHGRGNVIPQDLDLTVNLRRSPRSSRCAASASSPVSSSSPRPARPRTSRSTPSRSSPST